MNQSSNRLLNAYLQFGDLLISEFMDNGNNLSEDRLINI